MRGTYQLLAIAAAVVALYGSARVVGADAFRPPAVPLVTMDPYTSVWSFSDHLYDSWPVHWTGQVHAMAGMIRVDGRAYRFMGPDAVCSTAAEQTRLEVRATATYYTFRAGPVELNVQFITPMLPKDADRLSAPVTFMICRAHALDKAAHEVTVYFDASGEWVVN